jgi:hypothetical protein
MRSALYDASWNSPFSSLPHILAHDSCGLPYCAQRDCYSGAGEVASARSAGAKKQLQYLLRKFLGAHDAPECPTDRYSDGTMTNHIPNIKRTYVIYPIEFYAIF